MSYSLILERSKTLTSASDSELTVTTKKRLCALESALMQASKRIKYNALNYAQIVDNSNNSVLFAFDVKHCNIREVIRLIRKKSSDLFFKEHQALLASF